MAGLFNFGARKKRNHREDRTPVSDASFVVIDTELTGLNEKKDSIVSLGAVRMIGTSISLGDPFYRLVKPETELTRESVIIHGIVPSDVAAEEDIASVLEKFLVFCGSSIVVGHCVAIDLAFLEREMKRVPGHGMENPVLDTAELFGWMSRRGVLECCKSMPREPELYGLCQCLEIPVSEAHHALADAFITAQIFQRFLPLLQEQGITTIGELARIGDPTGGGDWFRSRGEFGNL